MYALRRKFSTGRVLLTLAVLLMQAHVILAEERDGVVAVPDEAAQARALALVREVYEEDYQTAKTSADKTALAKKMIDQAAETVDDPVARFVLLRVARDMASKAGDADTAIDAVDRIARTYDVDGTAMKVDSLLTAAPAAKSLDTRKSVAEHSLALVQATLDAEDYPTANRLAETALAAARKVRDGALVKRTMALRTRVTKAEHARAELNSGLATLREKPNDREGNFVVGRYYALRQGDWEKGIPLLALGSDEAFRTLAQRELKGADSPEEQAKLGDGWWTLARTREGWEKSALLLRAGMWYLQAKAGFPSGLTLVKVNKRLEDLDKLGRPIPTMPVQPPRLPEGAVLVMTFDPDTFAATDGKAYVSNLSGVGNHGLLQGGPTPSEGKAGGGLKFDGRDDQVLLPSLRAHLVQNLKAITISMWVKESDAKKNGFIFDVGSLKKSIGLVWYGEIARYRFYAPQHPSCRSEIVEGGQWRHLVARCDGSQQSLYLDGKLHDTKPTSDFMLSETTVSLETARIGGQAMRPVQEKRYFNGFIDEVAVFTRALSEEEIQTLYQMGLQGQSLQMTRKGKPVR